MFEKKSENDQSNISYSGQNVFILEWCSSSMLYWNVLYVSFLLRQYFGLMYFKWYMYIVGGTTSTLLSKLFPQEMAKQICQNYQQGVSQIHQRCCTLTIVMASNLLYIYIIILTTSHFLKQYLPWLHLVLIMLLKKLYLYLNWRYMYVTMTIMISCYRIFMQTDQNLFIKKSYYTILMKENQSTYMYMYKRF